MKFLPFFGCLFIARVNNVLIDLILDDSYKWRNYNYVINPKKRVKTQISAGYNVKLPRRVFKLVH